MQQNLQVVQKNVIKCAKISSNKNILILFLFLTLCPFLLNLKELSVKSHGRKEALRPKFIEEETNRREVKGRRCCLGAGFIQFHDAQQIDLAPE